MKPHLAYRATVVLVPLGALVTVLGAVDGNWLAVASGALITVSGVVNLGAARRRGIGWHGPKTFRELRAIDAKRREER
jgi:hypothetical protein